MYCVICGKEFQAVSVKNITCSKECGKERNRQRALKLSERKKHVGIVRCFNCGKEFMQTHGNQRICSPECKKEYYAEYGRKKALERSREASAERAKQRTEIKCSECGRVFIPPKKGVVTCSNECSKKRAERLGRERVKAYARKEYTSAAKKLPGKTGKKAKSLTEIEKAAMAKHLSYGQYVARYGL